MQCVPKVSMHAMCTKSHWARKAKKDWSVAYGWVRWP
jgi:hypothetical protein